MQQPIGEHPVPNKIKLSSLLILDAHALVQIAGDLLCRTVFTNEMKFET